MQPKQPASLLNMHLHAVPCNFVFVPTGTGNTARMISRFKPLARIVALSYDDSVCQGLMFSYGVSPVHLEYEPENWSDFARNWLAGYRRTREYCYAGWRTDTGKSRRQSPD